MRTVDENDFASHTREYLAEVARGVSVCISSGDRTIAVILPVGDSRDPRPLGLYRGQFSVPEDFNAPLPEDLRRAFEGE